MPSLGGRAVGKCVLLPCFLPPPPLFVGDWEPRFEFPSLLLLVSFPSPSIRFFSLIYFLFLFLSRYRALCAGALPLLCAMTEQGVARVCAVPLLLSRCPPCWSQ